MGVFSHVYKRPRLNQSWNAAGQVVSHHEEETWLQLFIDLIYVAFFMTLGKGIAYCEEYEGEDVEKILGAAGLLFAIYFALRFDIDLYANRFHSRDVITRFLYLVFTIGVVIMSIHIYKVGTTDACPLLGLQSKAELVGFIIAYSAIVILNAIAIYANPRTQPQLGLEFFFSILYLLFAVIVVGPIENSAVPSFFRVTVPFNYFVRTEFVGQFIRPHFNKHLGPYLFSKNCGPLQLDRDVIPINLHTHQIRLCMLVMIALGEGMIQVIYPSLPSDTSYMDRIYGFVVSCVMILFGLAMLYADAVVRDPHLDHAMHRDPKVSGVLWTYLHLFLGYFIFLTGISMELAIAEVYKNEPIQHTYDTLLGVCVGGATLCMTIMRATHKGLLSLDDAADSEGWDKTFRRHANYSFRILAVVLHFVFAYVESEDENLDYDDTSAAMSTENAGIGAAAGYSNTDDARNYHNAASRDRYFYIHASIIVASLFLEVVASFLCKKNDRSSSANRISLAPATLRESSMQQNPIHKKEKESDDASL